MFAARALPARPWLLQLPNPGWAESQGSGCSLSPILPLAFDLFSFHGSERLFLLELQRKDTGISMLLQESHSLGTFHVFSNFSEATDTWIRSQVEVPYIHRLASWRVALIWLGVTPSLSVSVIEHHLVLARLCEISLASEVAQGLSSWFLPPMLLGYLISFVWALLLSKYLHWWQIGAK